MPQGYVRGTLAATSGLADGWRVHVAAGRQVAALDERRVACVAR